MLQRNHLQRLTFKGLCAAGILFLLPFSVPAAPYFEDGFLGLTQKELHDKMGMPQAVRDRKSALRVFTYYAITDWDKYFRKLVSPENGEDVYTFKRDGIEVRYSFSYAVDPNDQSENRTLYVRLVDIEFSPAVPISQVPSLVPEFKPPTDAASPAFRSNIWVLLFKGPASPQARFIVKEATKDSARLDACLPVVLAAGAAGSAYDQISRRPHGDQYAKHRSRETPPEAHSRSHDEPLLARIFPAAAGSSALPSGQEGSCPEVRRLMRD